MSTRAQQVLGPGINNLWAGLTSCEWCFR